MPNYNNLPYINIQSKTTLYSGTAERYDWLRYRGRTLLGQFISDLQGASTEGLRINRNRRQLFTVGCSRRHKLLEIAVGYILRYNRVFVEKLVGLGFL